MKRRQTLFLVMLLMTVITLISVRMQNSSLKHLLRKKGQSQTTLRHGPTLIPDKWIITSSLQSAGVTEIPGWVILLYDHGNHDLCRYPACVTLGDWQPHPVIEDGDSHSKLAAHRRISAYLFAISQGATFIGLAEILYPSIEQTLQRFIYKGTTTAMVPVTDVSFVEPSSLFLRDAVNPKPHNLLLEPNNMFYEYAINEKVSPVIQVRTKMSEKTYYSDIIAQLPPVFLPVDTFTSLGSDVILFRYDAFWALVMLELGNEWGQIIIQKLIWQYGASVGLFPDNVQRSGARFNFETNYLDKTTANIAGNVMLKKWKCRQRSFTDCIRYFVIFCNGQNFITFGESDIVNLFMKELRNIGYSFPSASQDYPPLHFPTRTFGVMKIPSERFPENSIASEALSENCPQARMDFSVTCNADIGLIVTFNTANLYKNIPLLESMYRPYFKHILYCGPNISDFLKIAHNSSIGYFIFLEAFKHKWLFMYDCSAEALKLNLNVKGFLQIGDDTILNSWNIRDQPREKIWLHTGMRTVPVSRQIWDWGFWTSGKRRVLNLLNEMKKISLLNETATIKKFVTNFRSNSNNYKNIFVSGCDFLYMPSKLKDEFATISDIFTRHGIMLEIGFANMAMGLQRRDEINFVQDGSLWRGNRTKWASVYNKNLIFMHPFKLGRFIEKDEGERILCEDYFNAPS